MSKEIKQWITIKGRHIPIFEGETKQDAIKRVTQKKAPKAVKKSKTVEEKKVTKEEFDKAKKNTHVSSAGDFYKTDKFKNAFDYAKGKIDKEVYSWPETVYDARYEHGLSYSEGKALEDVMRIYAMKKGKFKEYHEMFKKDFERRGIDIREKLNKRDMTIRETNKPEDLLAGEHYTNRAEYKLKSDWLREHSKEYNEKREEYLKTIDALDKAKDKYTDPKLVKTLGKNQARFLVNEKEHPELMELRQKADRLDKDTEEFKKRRTEYNDYFEKMDKLNSASQRREYGRPEFEKAYGQYPGFETRNPAIPYYDDLLKKGKAEVVEMTPEQYIHECAHYIFTDSTFEKTLRGRIDDADTQKYAKMMRDGIKFYTPYLNYTDEGQEGLHRAIAAYINGIEKIPVIIVGTRR